MIARQHRFHGLNSLRTVYKYGQTVRSGSLTLKYNLNPKRQTYRCAVVVSKKVEKSAVGRNRIRRRIFEIVRLSGPRITKPYDLVISVFAADAKAMDSQKLQQQVHKLLTEAGIIDAGSQK